MYEVGSCRSFRAQHVMPGVEGPEGVLHSHDYTVDAVITAPALDERGMVCDLDVLDAALDELVAKVNDADLGDAVEHDSEAVTVEVFARWGHEQLAARVGLRSGNEMRVRIWESATAFGGYSERASS